MWSVSEESQVEHCLSCVIVFVWYGEARMWSDHLWHGADSPIHYSGQAARLLLTPCLLCLTLPFFSLTFFAHTQCQKLWFLLNIRQTNKIARRLTCSIFNGDLGGSPEREAEGGPVWETRFYHLYSSSNSFKPPFFFSAVRCYASGYCFLKTF